MHTKYLNSSRLAAMGVRFVEGDGDDHADQAGQGSTPHAGPETATAPGQPGDGTPQRRENGEHGFPVNTPVAEMTVEQREAYWRQQAKKHEAAWKSVRDRNLTPEQILDMEQRLADMERERMSDQEKAVEDAKKKAAQDAAAMFAPRLAKAVVEAALAKVGLGEDRIDSEIEWADLTKFLTPKGDVDADKVTAFAESRRASTREADEAGKKKFPDMGGGKRGPVTLSAKARAEQVARERGWLRDDK